MTSNAKLQISQDGLTSGLTAALVPGEWNMVYVSYLYTVGGYGAAIIYLNTVGGISVVSGTVHGSSVFSNSDRVRFGEGFIGQLRRIQVYSPATFRLNTGLFIHLLYFSEFK